MPSTNKTTYDEEGVLNVSGVVHGAEEMCFQLEDHKLFEELVSEEELLGGTGDVSVVVEDTHARVTSKVDLEGHVLGHIEIHVSLVRGVGTHGSSSREVVEALVSDFIDHFDDLFI